MANWVTQFWHQRVLGHITGSHWTNPDTGNEHVVCGCWQAQWVRSAR